MMAGVQGCRHWESKTMNNEVEIEEIDKNLREARRIGRLNFKLNSPRPSLKITINIL